MQYTTNYGLKMPDGNENIKISVWNENMKTIDDLLQEINKRITDLEDSTTQS